ncbi:hypothetical protein ACRAWF_36460 [Streptomyces sp. L7]
MQTVDTVYDQRKIETVGVDQLGDYRQASSPPRTAGADRQVQLPRPGAARSGCRHREPGDRGGLLYRFPPNIGRITYHGSTFRKPAPRSAGHHSPGGCSAGDLSGTANPVGKSLCCPHQLLAAAPPAGRQQLPLSSAGPLPG